MPVFVGADMLACEGGRASVLPYRLDRARWLSWERRIQVRMLVDGLLLPNASLLQILL